MLSTVTAIIGTLVPMIFITVLGVFWLLQGRPINMEISTNAFLPDIKLDNLVLVNGILYSLLGMEMSAVHVQEVKNPQKDYPKALYYSTIIILFSLALSSLAVAIVVPSKQLNLVTGLLDAFSMFFSAFHMEWLMPVVALLIIVGVIGGVGAWIIGPAKGLLVAAEDGCIPKFLQHENSKKMPFAILMVQGLIFSIICLVFLVMPTVNSSFWILSNLTSLLALSCYILIFAAAIRLRYKYPEVKRAYRIPFGNFGMWVIGIAGILACAFAVLISFVPPSQIVVGNLMFYEGFLITGFVGFYLTAFIIYKVQQKQNP
jgi:amino acid transporter